MFAPKVAKPQTKAAEAPTSSLVPHHSTLEEHRHGHDPVAQALFLQRAIGNQATLRLLAQQDSRVTRSKPRRQDEQAAEPVTRTIPSFSWDFSKVPIFPPDRPNGFEARSSLSAPRLTGIIQPKLVVGDINDPLEHEADRVAEQVMRTPDPTPSVSTASEQISRKCAACDEGALTLRTKIAQLPNAATGEAPRLVSEVLRAPGKPLDGVALPFFERRFGYDFSKVRVHTDDRAAESAAAIGANAYTVGREIVFGRGLYDPTTQTGRKLLSHELMHIVQAGQNARLARHVWRQASPDVGSATRFSTALNPVEDASPMAGVSPSSFSFHTIIPDDGTGVSGGWQETECETIRFVGGFPFFPTKIDVKLRVGVPIRNQRQGVITPGRAQAESIDAANLAGTEVLALLLDGDISPSQISSFFINLMQTHLLIDGRRVTTCTGGSKKAALSFAMNDSGSSGSAGQSGASGGGAVPV